MEIGAQRKEPNDSQRPIAARIVVRELDVAVVRDALGDKEVVRFVPAWIGVHPVEGADVDGESDEEGGKPSELTD